MMLYLIQFIVNISTFYFFIEKKLKEMIIFKKIYNFVYNVQIESIDEKWTNISWLINEEDSTRNNYYTNYIKEFESIVYPKNIPYLLICKDINYFVRENPSNIRNIDSYLFFSKSKSFQSNVTFHYIEYTHPKLYKPIQIKIDLRYLLIGNEILSSTFIAHYLHHNYGLYFYQSNYLLHIIDNEMNYITINKNNYLFIDKEKYYIKTQS